MTDEQRRRRPHGEVKNAMREYLAGKKGEPASIAEITAALMPQIGEAPKSSYRSALQDERYFERVSPGVFRIRG
ncbi:hypothetical protein [Mycolicibacterium lutetiense]|uniref:HTH HARE-type domain-containing protein n=1 Tax=Mycolicibacterium lutetiense TaxID=1641992 RepID=A0ABS4ZLP3_9MYCO|nr:hypothetical protein [Mycolicibacterium lutetiense]MBP2450121.1 hypothetical protein [Mycolicibacterium lutetiense]MBP2451931.1 hypothetical protein [Mycolicibacterium lutetiense]MBP2454138.1 hypothetical protein [Mycolicibacterium lutetiense]